MAKYADDTYLMVGAALKHKITEKIENVSSWARENNLQVNHLKTREMIIVRGRRKFQALPIL